MRNFKYFIRLLYCVAIAIYLVKHPCTVFCICAFFGCIYAMSCKIGSYFMFFKYSKNPLLQKSPNTLFLLIGKPPSDAKRKLQQDFIKKAKRIEEPIPCLIKKQWYRLTLTK